MKTKKKKDLRRLIGEFIKLQLAGNIPLVITYIGLILFNQLLNWEEFYALALAAALGNVFFFIADDKWVFPARKGQKKSRYEFIKFFIFVVCNASVIFSITYALSYFFGISPYLGQLVSTTLSVLWTFPIMRFWVFAQTKSKVRPRRRTSKQSA
ncbi:MAG: hypothetical protein UW38_C0001G0281 [Candidatus Saccharibacteria bacterium GW2011_GWC2_44_17]|nr:MAG: hypothetical protein UW38_C0001G0281 [Candidatus Saccharibacteria bacterium GW2011_GWC2_44_17]OGL33239.1 MAG: hypothetical protein A3E20_01365 [Candidatus Saccharibacteria bacterium RIFCSPHIGHO2_12_FULL_47_16]